MRIEPATFRWLCPLKLREPTPITVSPCVLLNNSEWFFGYYKLNVLTLARITTVMYDFFTCAPIQIFFYIYFIYPSWLSVPILYSTLYWTTQQVICADSLRRLILQCSTLSIILTLSHKGRWIPFSFHIWSAIPDFSISPRTIAFRCSSSLTFSGRPVSRSYILPPLQGME